MPYSPRVKRLAYKMDPACWRSYSGLFPSHKRRMDARRRASLEEAQRAFNFADKIISRVLYKRAEVHMPPMKIAMMLHFATVIGPYSTHEQRISLAYAKFVRQLLADGMIMRPSHEDRAKHDGWAYTATKKGMVYVEALKRVPLPVQANPEWIMPASGGVAYGEAFGVEGPHGSDHYRPGDEVKGFDVA